MLEWGYQALSALLSCCGLDVLVHVVEGGCALSVVKDGAGGSKMVNVPSSSLIGICFHKNALSSSVIFIVLRVS